MDDDLLQPILEDLVLSTHIEVVQEMLLSLRDVPLFVHEVVQVLEFFVNVELFPEHPRKLHRQRLDPQPDLPTQLLHCSRPLAHYFLF